MRYLLLSLALMFTSCGQVFEESQLRDGDAPVLPDWDLASIVEFIGEENTESHTITSIILVRNEIQGTYTATLHVDRREPRGEESEVVPEQNEPMQIAQFLICKNQLSESEERTQQTLVGVICYFDHRGAGGPLVEVIFTLNKENKFDARRIVTPAEIIDGAEPVETELARDLGLKIVGEPKDPF